MPLPTHEDLDTTARTLEFIIDSLFEHQPISVNDIDIFTKALEKLPSRIKLEDLING